MRAKETSRSVSIGIGILAFYFFYRETDQCIDWSDNMKHVVMTYYDCQYFFITTPCSRCYTALKKRDALFQGISDQCCTVVQRADGYGYQQVAKTDATGTPPKPGTLGRSALYLPGLNAEVSCAK
jgi:hypothetical protein